MIIIELLKSVFRSIRIEKKKARLMTALNINSPDDAAKFLDREIARLEADGKPGDMEYISYVMLYLNAQDNWDLFRKYDAYFRSENVSKDIKESYEKSYYELILARYGTFCIL